MKKDINKERFKEFLAEAEEILESMGKGLLKLERGMKAGVIDTTVINGIFRSAHTLKGMAGIFSIKEMSSLSHSMEDTLDSLRLGRISLTDNVLDCIMRTHGLLVRIVGSKGKKDHSKEIQTLRRGLEKCLQIKKAKSRVPIDKELLSVLTEYEEHRLRENLANRSNIYTINARFPIPSFDKEYVALTELLKGYGEVIATLPSGRESGEMLTFDLILGSERDMASMGEVLKDRPGIEIKAFSEPALKKEHKPSGSVSGLRRARDRAVAGADETVRSFSNTVRVDIGKLDNIMNIVGELSALRTSFARLSSDLKNMGSLSYYGVELSVLEKQLEKKLDELRDGVLGVRMVPIGQLFGRFETFLSRLSRETGKELRMVTYGDETELDKLIAEEIADPLMHILRNTVDHGIEKAEKRERLGKPRAGTITLSAYQKGNHVVVEIKDDGGGIDEGTVKRIAAAKGLVSKQYVKKLSRREALELIFLPGFSTREVVSEVSGRGVGMDVVRENITRLSGVIDIETVRGKGTRFILTIPITLAIIQALIVEDGGSSYAVPLNAVIEVTEVPSSEKSSIELSEEIKIRGRTMPSIRLAGFFGKDQPAGKTNTCYGIVAGLAEHRFCIIVDHLIGEQDVVIKPLSRVLKVPGIAGAANLGDRGTILVVDVTGVLEMVLKERKALINV